MNIWIIYYIKKYFSNIISFKKKSFDESITDLKMVPDAFAFYDVSNYYINNNGD